MEQGSILPFFDQDHLALRTRLREWVHSDLWAYPGIARDVATEARRIVKALGAAEFLKYAVPRSFGGRHDEVQARDLCIVREELACGEALADTMFAVQALGSHPISIAGTEKQKNRYLPPLARGTKIAAFALTEPEAGSDVSSLQTMAVKRGEEYLISGTKRFISNAGIADHYIVFASSDPKQRARGISAFIGEANSPGMKITEKTDLLSPHPIGALSFEECMVPEEALLGKEGDGLKIAFGTLDLLRCTVGAAAVGFAQRALEEAIRYSSSRYQFGKTIAEFQGIQFKLAEMATDLEAARLLVYQAAWTHDCGGEEKKRKSSMSKLFATEAAQKIVDQSLQIHGGAGLVADSIMERLYRDVRALRIYEGTSEIQKLIIARELLKKPKP